MSFPPFAQGLDNISCHPEPLSEFVTCTYGLIAIPTTMCYEKKVSYQGNLPFSFIVMHIASQNPASPNLSGSGGSRYSLVTFRSLSGYFGSASAVTFQVSESCFCGFGVPGRQRHLKPFSCPHVSGHSQQQHC